MAYGGAVFQFLKGEPTGVGQAPAQNGRANSDPKASNLKTCLDALTVPRFGPHRDLYLRVEKQKHEDKNEQPGALIAVTSHEQDRVSYSSALKRLGKMVWQNAKGTALIQGVASVTESAAVITSMYFMAKVFRSFETVYQGGAASTELFTNLAIVVGLGAIAFYKPVSAYVGARFSAKMQLANDKEIMKAISSRKLNELETEALRKEITFVRDNKWRYPQLAESLLKSSGSAVEMVFAGSLLTFVAYQSLGATHTVAIASLLALAAVPRVLSEIRHTKDLVETESAVANVRRKSWFLQYFAVETENVSELKKLGEEEKIQRMALDRTKEVLDLEVGVAKRHSIQNLFSSGVAKGTALGCAGIFVAQAWSGQLAPEILGLSVAALYRFNSALTNLSVTVGEQLKNLQFFRRASELFENGEKSADLENARRTQSLPHSEAPLPIVLKDVSYAHHGESALTLKGVNLVIAPSEYVAIVGPNGGGKTTLLKVLTGVYPSTDGEVLLGELPIQTIKQEELSRYIGVVGQDGKLFHSLTIEESVSLGARDLNPTSFWTALKSGLAEPLVRGLKKREGTVIGSGFDLGQDFSSGESQKLLASRLFRGSAKIMILDEPGSNLDPQSDILLAHNLGKWKQEEGSTVILITHDLRAAATKAQRIVVIEGGVVTGDGSHEQLLQSNDWYRESYFSQTDQSVSRES